jgi:hypothetical protein
MPDTTNTLGWKVISNEGTGSEGRSIHTTRDAALQQACAGFPFYRDGGSPLRIEGPNGERISAAEIKQHCQNQSSAGAVNLP